MNKVTRLFDWNNVSISKYYELKDIIEDPDQDDITKNVRLSEAPSYGKPAILYDARSAGADNYLNLAREIIKKNESWQREQL